MNLRPLLLIAVCVATAAAAELRVVATIPVIADLVRQVAGERAEVVSIIPPGADHHIYQPLPADAQRLANAHLVVANGLGFEPWLPGMIAAAAYRGAVAEASAGVAPRSADDAGHEPNHADVDPHAFHDVRNAQQYVKNIRAALVAADAAGAEVYRVRADLVLAELGVLDAWVRRQVATLPPARRVLFAPHDGLNYFAAAYGLELHPVEGIGHGQETDVHRLDSLAALVRARGVRVVFSEDGQGAGALKTLAEAAGASVAGPLATCGPAAGQGYREMMVANTLAIVSALR